MLGVWTRVPLERSVKVGVGRSQALRTYVSLAASVVSHVTLTPHFPRGRHANTRPTLPMVCSASQPHSAKRQE